MLHTGQRVAHYQIGSLLGVGGMGEVYLADEVRHQRRVALKLLRPDVAHSLGSPRPADIKPENILLESGHAVIADAPPT